MKSQPNYKKIYRDIISKDYPEKKTLCESILNKEILSSLDVIRLNDILFKAKDKQTLISNQKFRSYTKSDILYILSYQTKNKLNNEQIKNKFKISRNTIAKWKKIFINNY